MESPSLGFPRYLLADAAAHSVAVFEETLQRHIAQTAHGGISHIGAQGATRIGVSEEIVFRIAYAHFIRPNPMPTMISIPVIRRMCADVILNERSQVLRLARKARAG
jgi:hypothetical protein